VNSLLWGTAVEREVVQPPMQACPRAMLKPLISTARTRIKLNVAAATAPSSAIGANAPGREARESSLGAN
jgi:hypothetical protein